MNKVGYIYSLTCSNPNLIYYGSTTKSLNERLINHRSKKCTSRILFEWGNVKINMLEEIEFEDKQELLDRESYYIRNLKCVNKVIPNRTVKEYRDDYYKKNRDEILNKQKKIVKCECGLNFTIHHEARHKRCKQHLQFIKYGNKLLYNQIKCECGVIVTKDKYNRHCKSKKHLQYIEKNSNIKL